MLFLQVINMKWKAWVLPLNSGQYFSTVGISLKNEKGHPPLIFNPCRYKLNDGGTGEFLKLGV
jgi:hypothetical protein